MASALPEGQEALEVESACSENRPVGGQAHPVSSNTTGKTLNIQLTAWQNTALQGRYTVLSTTVWIDRYYRDLGSNVLRYCHGCAGFGRTYT